MNTANQMKMAIAGKRDINGRPGVMITAQRGLSVFTRYNRSIRPPFVKYHASARGGMAQMELGTCLMCLYDSVCSCIAIYREATVKNYETGNKKTDDTRRYSSL